MLVTIFVEDHMLFRASVIAAMALYRGDGEF